MSTLSALTLFPAWPQCVLCLFERHSLAQTCIISLTQRTVWSFDQGFYLNMHTFGIVRFPQGVDRKGTEVWILCNCVFACLCLLRILYLSTLIAQGSFSNRCLSRRMLYCNFVPFYDILMRHRPLLWSCVWIYCKCFSKQRDWHFDMLIIDKDGPLSLTLVPGGNFVW